MMLRHENTIKSLLFRYGGPHRTFHSNVKHRKNELFYHFIHASGFFAYIALFFLNRKKQQCNKYYSGVPNSNMSDVKNIYSVYQFIADAQFLGD